MFVLDTNAISELRKSSSGRADRGVTEWATNVPTTLMFMSVISLHELEHGLLLAERSDPTKGAILRTWLNNSVRPAFADRLLDIDAKIAIQSASSHMPDAPTSRDALIAATAVRHDMTVVTRNVRDFERLTGAEVMNPWAANPLRS